MNIKLIFFWVSSLSIAKPPYHQGNYLGTINYIWQIPEIEVEQNETLKVRMLAKIHEELPHWDESNGGDFVLIWSLDAKIIDKTVNNTVI